MSSDLDLSHILVYTYIGLHRAYWLIGFTYEITKYYAKFKKCSYDTFG